MFLKIKLDIISKASIMYTSTNKEGSKMLIITKFNSNDRITASTVLATGVKINVRTARDYHFGTLQNSDIAVEKLLTELNHTGDIEFVVGSMDSGYTYITLNQDTLKTTITGV